MPATWVATRDDVPLADLARYPGNARRGNVGEIRKSIRRHGQYKSLIVRDAGDGQLVILAGNHTADALTAEGNDTARCEIITCSDDEAARINLTDNRMADLSGWDNEALTGLLESLDGDFDGTGWEHADLESFHHLAAPPDLDDLARDLGDPGHDDTWPAIRIRAPHHVVAAWNDHAKAYAGNDAAALAGLLGLTLTA